MEHTIGLIIRLRAFPPESISFPQLLLIASKHEVTLIEARRYILTKYPQADFDWTILSDGELAVAVQQCLAFVSKERAAWEKMSQQFKKRLVKYNLLFDKLKSKYGLSSNISKEVMLRQLKQRHQYFQLNSKDCPKRPQYQELGTFVCLLQHIIHFQAEEQKYARLNDNELTRKAVSILSQLQTSIETQLNEQREAILNQFRQAEKAYHSMLQACKKDLQQLFLFYCMESNPKGSDFDTYQKLSQMLDLRFYLKYFKDVESRQTNNIHYSQADLIGLFKKFSCNGRWINFNEFWAIHKKLFRIEEVLKKSKQKQYPAVELAALSQKYEEETERLQSLFTMISASGINDRIKKLAASPPKLVRSRSLSLPQLTPHISPQKKEGLKRKLSFIQQVRHEISQQTLPKRNSVHALPDILRLPSEKIQSQGIYQSLKRFANYDYIAQQRKIKSIIGLSGTIEGFMDEFTRREESLKVGLVEKEKSRVKQGHRKDGHNHERCRRYKIEQVEPYLRF